MFGALNTSTSALVANRTRAEVYAANLANANAIQDENGENNPFRKRLAILSSGDGQGGPGVHVREIQLDEKPPKLRYMPNHPLADADGYVKFPNIDSIVEQINMMEASRAYEANVTAAEATKSMLRTSLRLMS